MKHNISLFQKILLAVTFFTALAAADTATADTTYYKDPQGNLYGIISPRNAAAESQASPVPLSESPEPLTVITPQDSVPIYQQLMDSITTKGYRLHRKGKGFLWLGIGMVATGGVLMYGDLLSNCDEETCDTGPYFYLGYMTLLAGGGFMTTGITLKIIGNRQIRRGRQYERSLDLYRKNHRAPSAPQGFSLNLHVMPLVDPARKSGGVRVAAEF